MHVASFYSQHVHTHTHTHRPQSLAAIPDPIPLCTQPHAITHVSFPDFLCKTPFHTCIETVMSESVPQTQALINMVPPLRIWDPSTLSTSSTVELRSSLLSLDWAPQSEHLVCCRTAPTLCGVSDWQFCHYADPDGLWRRGGQAV